MRIDHWCLVAGLASLLAGCGKKQQQSPPDDKPGAKVGSQAAGAAADGSPGSAAVDSPGSAVAVLADAGAGSATPAVTVDPAQLISPDGVGPINSKTAGKLATLQKLVPRLKWRKNVTESGGEDADVFDAAKTARVGESPVLRVVPSEGKVYEVHVFAPGFMTAMGIEAGHTGEALAKAYPNLACTLESGEVDDLVCTTASLPKIRFSLEVPTGLGDEVTVAQIATQKIEAIHWSAEAL